MRTKQPKATENQAGKVETPKNGLDEKRKGIGYELGELTLDIAIQTEILRAMQQRANDLGTALRELRKVKANGKEQR